MKLQVVDSTVKFSSKSRFLFSTSLLLLFIHQHVRPANLIPWSDCEEDRWLPSARCRDFRSLPRTDVRNLLSGWCRVSPEFRRSESEAYHASVCVCLRIRRAVFFSIIHIHGVVLSEHRNYVFFFYLRGLIVFASVLLSVYFEWGEE